METMLFSEKSVKLTQFYVKFSISINYSDYESMTAASRLKNWQNMVKLSYTFNFGGLLPVQLCTFSLFFRFMFNEPW